MFQDGEAGHEVGGLGAACDESGAHAVLPALFPNLDAKIVEELLVHVQPGDAVEERGQQQGLGSVAAAEVDEMSAGREPRPGQAQPPLQDPLTGPGRFSTRRQARFRSLVVRLLQTHFRRFLSAVVSVTFRE